jgi:hypothetical protein
MLFFRYSKGLFMSKINRASYSKVSWNEVRDQVRKINPELCKIIDGIDTKDKYPLYKVRYPFGSNIIDSGIFHYPSDDGNLAPLLSNQVPSHIRTQLGYNGGGIPMGLILNRSVELFLQTEERVIPFSVKQPGDLCSLWAALNQTRSYVWPHVWNMTAGARSLFVLPKITDNIRYKKLCRARGIRMAIPRTLNMHWSLLSKMSQHSDYSKPWFTEILFFSENWLKNRPDEGWLKFHHYLHQEGWSKTEYWRNKIVYDHIWDIFVRDLTKQDLKASSYVIEMVKHVIMVGLGIVPGFCPAINDNEAPFEKFQEDLIDIYGLKNFSPAIMVPHHYSAEEKRPVYWSLHTQSHFETTIKAKTFTSTLSILKEISDLIDQFKQSILKHTNKLAVDSPLEELIKRTQLDFFHSEIDEDGQIRQSLEMPKEDKNLIQNIKKFGKRTFSDVSPFVRGCIRFVC